MKTEPQWVRLWIEGERMPLFGRLNTVTLARKPMVRLVGDGVEQLFDPATIRRVEILPESFIKAFPPSPKIGIKMIQREVVKAFNLNDDDLVMKRGPTRVCNARMIAMFLCRDLTDESLTAIGSSFGGKDNSTVSHAVKSVTNWLETEPTLAKQVNILRTHLEHL